MAVSQTRFEDRLRKISRAQQTSHRVARTRQGLGRGLAVMSGAGRVALWGGVVLLCGKIVAMTVLDDDAYARRIGALSDALPPTAQPMTRVLYEDPVSGWLATKARRLSARLL